MVTDRRGLAVLPQMQLIGAMDKFARFLSDQQVSQNDEEQDDFPAVRSGVLHAKNLNGFA